MKFDLIVKNGRVVLPEDVADLDVGVKNGKVTALAKGLDPADAAEVVDAAGLFVCPGMVDAPA